MAAHNQTISVGYLLNDPLITNEGVEGEEKILFQLRTTHRNPEGYIKKQFEDVIVLCDDIKLMPQMKKLKKNDLIEIKGVFTVLRSNKASNCPCCGHKNIKENGTATFIYPISIIKLNALSTAYEWDTSLPEQILAKHYEEWSNNILIVGKIVTEPEMGGTDKHPWCRYMLEVDRKYFIGTQSDIRTDYPWVYTYGQKSSDDYLYLRKGSIVLVNGFISNTAVQATMKCEKCNSEYEYPDVRTSFITYSVEYLSNFYSPDDIKAMQEKIDLEDKLNKA